MLTGADYANLAFTKKSSCIRMCVFAIRTTWKKTFIVRSLVSLENFTFDYRTGELRQNLVESILFS